MASYSQSYYTSPKVFVQDSGNQSTHNYTWTSILPTPGASTSYQNTSESSTPPTAEQKPSCQSLVVRKKNQKTERKPSTALARVDKSNQAREKVNCSWKRASAVVNLHSKTHGKTVRMHVDTVTVSYERRIARLENLGNIVQKHLTIQRAVMVRRRMQLLPGEKAV